MTGMVTEPARNRTDRLALLLIVLVVLLGYGLAPTRLPLVGEETCRALHGIEMAQSGDWIIPTNQGLPILDRPPLQYWVLAVIHKWIHPLNALTLRLFMATVVLCTSLVIWWYTRAFLSSAGAFLAAVAYPTMGHILELGRRAETDGLFAFLLAAALLVWHYGYAQGWRPVRVWVLAGAVAALATLAKGTQGPVAFFGTVYLFLLLRRHWRYLFSWSHLAGLLVFVGLIAIWEVPFYFQTGWIGTRQTWLDPCTGRVDTNLAKLFQHLVRFPLSVLGATLPWSVLLVGLFHRSFWSLEAKARSAVLFVLLGMATIFLPVWLSEGGLRRYVMPMYPLLAVICGAAAQQCLATPLKSFPRELWRTVLRVLAVALAGFVSVLLVATIAGTSSHARWVSFLAQPWPLLLVLLLGTAAGFVSIWRRTAPGRTEDGIPAMFASAALLAVCFNGAVLGVIAKRAVHLETDVAGLKRSLPADVRLVSLGPVLHKFLYWYGQAIPIVNKPQKPDEVPADLEYFAMDVQRGQTLELPFAWKRIGVFNMDRSYSADPLYTVVVGQRLRPPAVPDATAPGYIGSR